MTRVKGHGLRNEGAPFVMSETGDLVRVSIYSHGGGVSGYGRGLCECGEFSPLLNSASQRRKWHREHKASVAA